MLFALVLLAANPPPSDGGQGATTSYTPRSDSSSTDSAVPLDWSGPAARRPGADASVQQFDPNVTLFEQNAMCVIVPGQPTPACAQNTNGALQVSGDIFTGSDNPDATCETIETTRMGADGKPSRVFATVCGDEAESWQYRQRSTPSSRGNPTRPTGRVLGPNDLAAPNQ